MTTWSVRSSHDLVNMDSEKFDHEITACICKQGNENPVMKCSFLRQLLSCVRNRTIRTKSKSCDLDKSVKQRETGASFIKPNSGRNF